MTHLISMRSAGRVSTQPIRAAMTQAVAIPSGWGRRAWVG